MHMSDENLQELKRSIAEVEDRFKECEEAAWNALSKEQQLDIFCAVVRRIHQGELVDKGSYRHVLYGTFGFGPEAYMQAQFAGYLDVHNAIVDSDHDFRTLEAFCNKYNVEDAKKKIIDFLI